MGRAKPFHKPINKPIHEPMMATKQITTHFAFVPDDRPARLIRFVQRGTLPSSDLVSLYDFESNLLIVDQQHYDRLSKAQQEAVLRTHAPAIELVDVPPDDRGWGDFPAAAE